MPGDWCRQLVGLSAGFVGVDRDPHGAAAQAGFQRVGFGEGVAEPDLERGRAFAEFGDPGREPGGAGAEPAEPFFEFRGFRSRAVSAPSASSPLPVASLSLAFRQFLGAFGEFAERVPRLAVRFPSIAVVDQKLTSRASFGVLDQARPGACRGRRRSPRTRARAWRSGVERGGVVGVGLADRHRLRAAAARSSTVVRLPAPAAFSRVELVVCRLRQFLLQLARAAQPRCCAGSASRSSRFVSQDFGAFLRFRRRLR